MRTLLCASVSLSTFFLAVLARGAQPDGDDASVPRARSWYGEAHGGPLFALYLPTGDGLPAEHRVAGGSQLVLGAGHGWDLGPLRVDLGARLQYQSLAVEGLFGTKRTDAQFRATYTFIAPLLFAGLTTRTGSRVDFLLGVSLGTATYFTDKVGSKVGVEQIPFYGSFEIGASVRLVSWLEARVVVAYQPPVAGGANIVAPQAGLRAAF